MMLLWYLLPWLFIDMIDANMEVTSSDDVGLVEVLDGFGRGLDPQFSFLCDKEVHKALSHLAKRGLNVKSRSKRRSRGGPSAPW